MRECFSIGVPDRATRTFKCNNAQSISVDAEKTQEGSEKGGKYFFHTPFETYREIADPFPVDSGGTFRVRMIQFAFHIIGIVPRNRGGQSS